MEHSNHKTLTEDTLYNHLQPIASEEHFSVRCIQFVVFQKVPVIIASVCGKQVLRA
jgi:hypothetical protein